MVDAAASLVVGEAADAVVVVGAAVDVVAGAAVGSEDEQAVSSASPAAMVTMVSFIDPPGVRYGWSTVVSASPSPGTRW